MRVNNRALCLSNSWRFPTQGDSLSANPTRASIRKLSAKYSTMKEFRYRSISTVENESFFIRRKLLTIIRNVYIARKIRYSIEEL